MQLDLILLKMKFVILFLCFVAVAETSDLSCRYWYYTATIAVSTDTENNVWEVGSDIQLTVDISCPKEFNSDRFYFYLVRSGKNINSVGYFSYIYIDGSYVYIYQRLSTGKITSYKWTNIYDAIKVDISLSNLTIFDNLSKLAITSRRGGDTAYSRPFVLNLCPSLTLPDTLYSNYKNSSIYKHGDVIQSTCRKNSLFVDDAYQGIINVTCSVNMTLAQWEIPGHECIVVCPEPALPDALYSNYNDSLIYRHGDVIQSTCRENSLFVNNTLQNSINVACSVNVTHAQWEIPEHECIVGCSNPARWPIKIYPSTSKVKYKLNTMLGVSCSDGRVFSSGPPTVFIDSILCQSNGEWDHANTNCWRDQVVEFKSLQQTLTSGIKTVFVCAPRVKSHKVRISLEKTVFESLNSTWWITTLNSKHNRIIAICEVIDGNKIVVERRSTLLNVKFAPELSHDNEDLQFELQNGKTGQVIIEFIANPVLSRSAIRITKNGTNIQHYYVTVKDFTHRVVVDFTEVRESDFGNYVIEVTSSSPVAGVLKANFTIFQSQQSSQEPFTVLHGATIAMGSIILIALVVAAIFMGRRMLKKYGTTTATGTNEIPDTVVYTAEVPDHPNYEDIETKQEYDVGNCGQSNGYVNMEFGQSTQQNPYTDERNRAIPPSPNNAGRRVALQPPNRQRRVEQENPYMMPSDGRW